MMQEWNLTFERELMRDTALRLSYIGNSRQQSRAALALERSRSRNTTTRLGRAFRELRRIPIRDVSIRTGPVAAAMPRSATTASPTLIPCRPKSNAGTRAGWRTSSSTRFPAR